jgi:hypothetical protein
LQAGALPQAAVAAAKGGMAPVQQLAHAACSEAACTVAPPHPAAAAYHWLLLHLVACSAPTPPLCLRFSITGTSRRVSLLAAGCERPAVTAESSQHWLQREMPAPCCPL